MQKPGLPQGMRDFGPETVQKRNYILQTIRSTFECYGFQPLETPAMENLETLMGKYGEEGDKLIFKVLNNGLHDEKNRGKANEGFQKLLEGKSTPLLTERAMKYDLTIPFARYVAMNHGQISYPFKRYQMQQVWRADRPQKGRYREFTQCDADIVGSRSIFNEADLAHIYHDVFSKLKLTGYVLKINSRKILSALAERCGGNDKLVDITTAIDKLDKIGLDKILDELQQKDLATESAMLVKEYLGISGDNDNVLAQLKSFFGENAIAGEGLAEVEKLVELTPSINIQIDPTLARGIDYYTGIIFEVKAPDTVQMGSIGGGGRYDDLTGLFGVKDLPGVGISFGIDRIYDVLEELQLFPESLLTGPSLLFFNMGENEARYCMPYLQQLRSACIAAELYPDKVKLDKQFKYAEKKRIPYVAIAGEQEIADQSVIVKNLSTGTQEKIAVSALPDFIRTSL